MEFLLNDLMQSVGGFVITAVVAIIVIQLTLRIFAEYERGIILRLGRLHRVAGPGVTFILPLIDVVYARIDTRVVSTQILAEQSLTADTTPVDVNAVIFWQVADPRKAALDVVNFTAALTGAAQTALRELIGRSTLHTLLTDSAALDRALQTALLAKAELWGLHLTSIEIRDIKLPENLQNAMSQQAQAERERQARVILGSAERDIAASFQEAARTYQDNPIALELRRMNILYEGLKASNTTMIVVPSSVADSLGSIAQNFQASKQL